MNKVNELTICKDNYDTKEEFQNAIRDAITSLLNNRYIAVVKYDEPGLGIVSIFYEYDDRSLGAPYPFFLTPEQAESIVINGEE